MINSTNDHLKLGDASGWEVRTNSQMLSVFPDQENNSKRSPSNLVQDTSRYVGVPINELEVSQQVPTLTMKDNQIPLMVEDLPEFSFNDR